MKRITGFVETVFFSSPTFSAGKLKTDQGLASFAGKVFAEEGKHLTLVGAWHRHPKFGFQFKVSGVEVKQELDPKGLGHFLANHPEIKGIGPAKAQKLVDHFGIELPKALNENPEQVAQVAAVSLETVENLKQVWEDHASSAGIMTWLSRFGLTHHQCETLLTNLGNNAKAVLEKNPYLLIREIDGMGFRRVDSVAQAMGVSKRNRNRVRAGIVECVKTAERSGHTWTSNKDLFSQANELLAMDNLDSDQDIQESLSDLIADDEVAQVDDGGKISSTLLYRIEREVAEMLRDGGPNEHACRDDLETLLEAQKRTLEPEQKTAVLRSITNRVSLISGGAGSGKTYTISFVVGLIQEFGQTLKLTAPTGKAAKRITEAVQLPAETIHRLLGFDGTNFKYNKNHYLDTDWIIVDEVSMVDIPLAWRLFQAVNWSRTSVILVGDHNQLEPVGPGYMLRDLMNTDHFPKTVLKTCKRQAGLLRENSLAILAGKVPPTPDPKDTETVKDWYVIPQFKDAYKCRGYLEHMFRNVLNEKFGLDLVSQVQVATPRHKGTLGTQEINRTLQKLIQKKLYDRDIPTVPEGRKPPIYRHDKVIMTQNNYDLDVMNGTTGIVLEEGDRFIIDFDGKVVEIDGKSSVMRQIELAYALTIHKLQGSEVECIIVICHKSHSFQLNRNLLYTGVTRGKRCAIILGDGFGIKTAAETMTVDSRRTHLASLVSQQKEAS